MKNPKIFSEILTCYKLDFDPKIMALLSDKIIVKDILIENGFGDIIIPTLAIFEKAKEISFDNLPSDFILKTNNASHTNVIVKDKSTTNLKKIQAFYRKKLRYRYDLVGAERHYHLIHKCIFAEALLHDADIVDYKFYCFNGKVKAIFTASDRKIVNGKEFYLRHFFDPSFNEMVDWLPPQEKRMVKKPENLELLIELAEKLSFGFPFLRLDFYESNRKIYFSEFTFTPAAGIPILSDQGEKELGKLFAYPFDKTYQGKLKYQGKPLTQNNHNGS